MKVTVTLGRGFQRNAEAGVQRALHALGALARDRATQLAQERLKTTAQSFVAGISGPSVTERSAVLTLNGTLANMMERGATRFDIKKMLGGRKYVDVPFRHGTPGTGRNPMSKPDFNVMQGLARAAKGAMARGPAVMPSGVQKSKTGYQHTEAKTGSMLRIQHTYKGASQATHLTFRRISKNSDPSSWIHPGFKPLGIFSLVAKEVRKLAPKVIADYLREGLR